MVVMVRGHSDCEPSLHIPEKLAALLLDFERNSDSSQLLTNGNANFLPISCANCAQGLSVGYLVVRTTNGFWKLLH
jgi:hypothetical protein